MSQNSEILAFLKTGQSITRIQAYNLLGCLRLAARINDLRNIGHEINTKIIELNGKRFAQYVLINSKEAQIT